MTMVTTPLPPEIRIDVQKPVNPDPRRAYESCLALTKSHYENFPVASWLLARRYRLPIAAVYAFARSADDIADEGDLPASDRLDRLHHYEQSLQIISEGKIPEEDLFVALADAIRRYNLPILQFRKLLTAFRQDVTRTRYACFQEILDYCDCSANPVGHIMLSLWGKATPQNIVYSNAICTALQLINFLQDMQVDYSKNRIYMAQDEIQRFGLDESAFAQPGHGSNWKDFMHLQIIRTRQMLGSGQALGKSLGGRAGMEVKTIVAGGMRVLELLEHNRVENNSGSVKLGARDWLIILSRSLLTSTA